MITIKDRFEFNIWIENRKQKKIPNDKKNEAKNYNIYIDCFFTDYIAAFLPRLIYAKGLLKNNPQCKLMALCDKNEKDINTIAEVYGITMHSIRTKRSLIRAIITAIYIFFFKNTTRLIYSLTYNDIEIGKYVADFLIRYSSDLFTMEKVRFRDLKHLIKFYWALYEADELFKKNPPDMYVVLEVGYFYGPIIKLAKASGAKIVQCLAGLGIREIGNGRPINNQDNDNYQIQDIIKQVVPAGIDYRQWTDEYYARRMRGLTDIQATAAYSNKIVFTREEWVKKNHANPNQKNVVIMAHCFSDDANSVTSRTIYRDYYQWLIRTLEIIQGIDNVNWLLKAHPSRHLYGEGECVYEIFERYANKDNIFIVEDEMSTEALFNIIDGAVTVVGTCGLEFSSFGIPVVCAGFASFGGFGFTIEPTTEDEYIKCLKNMVNAEKLSEEKIDMARKVSYVLFNLTEPKDDMDKLLWNSLKKNPIESSDYVIKKMNELFEKGFFEGECYYYKKANADYTNM